MGEGDVGEVQYCSIWGVAPSLSTLVGGAGGVSSAPFWLWGLQRLPKSGGCFLEVFVGLTDGPISSLGRPWRPSYV
jgi:hypothetical protein